MTAYLDVKNLQQFQDYVHRRYFVQLRPEHRYADLFVPTFWAFHRGKLGENDWVRVRAHDGHFDVLLTVAEMKTDGVVMKRWPVEPTAQEAAEAAEAEKTVAFVPYANDGKPVVRVEFLPATQWRVIGLKAEVISEGHKEEAAARKVMAEYLKGIRHAMPSDEDQAAEMKRHEAKVASAEMVAQARRDRDASRSRVKGI
jgi:hypothetical protein